MWIQTYKWWMLLNRVLSTCGFQGDFPSVLQNWLLCKKKSRFTEQVSQIISIKIDIMQPIFLTNSYSGGKHNSTSIILTHMECLLLDKKLKWSVTLYNLKGSLGFALIASVFFNHHIWVYLHHRNLPQSKALEKDLWLLFTDLHLWNVFTNINHVMLSCINN